MKLIKQKQYSRYYELIFMVNAEEKNNLKISCTEDDNSEIIPSIYFSDNICRIELNSPYDSLSVRVKIKIYVHDNLIFSLRIRIRRMREYQSAYSDNAKEQIENPELDTETDDNISNDKNDIVEKDNIAVESDANKTEENSTAKNDKDMAIADLEFSLSEINTYADSILGL